MREDLELALRLLTQEFHAGGISGDRAEATAAIRRCLLRLTAGRGEAENGPDSTGEPSRRASTRKHLARAIGVSACGLCRLGLTHQVTETCYELASQ